MIQDRVLAGLAFLALLAAPLVCGCASPPPSPPHHTESTADDYVLVILKRGPGASVLSDAERQAIQAEHLANIGRLAEAGRIVVAGPFGRENHDPTQRGIFIFDVATLEEARTLTNTDPAVIAGVLTMELARLETDADLRGALAAELAAQQAARDAGRERPMSETIRAYVLVRADHASEADRRIAMAVPSEKLVAAGRVGGTGGFYIIDSTSVAEVRNWLRSWLDEVDVGLGPVTPGTHGTPGTHVHPVHIDEWYASALLVEAAR